MVNRTAYVGTLFSNINDPKKITVAFTMGVKALEQGHSATVILMVDAVHLARPGSLDDVDIGAPFMPANALKETFIEKGGQVLVCKACMIHNGVADDEVDARYEVISADDVIQLLMNAQGSLQLN